MMVRWLAAIAALMSAMVGAAFSTDTTAPDIPEPGSVEAIAKASGDPRFLSPWFLIFRKRREFLRR